MPKDQETKVKDLAQVAIHPEGKMEMVLKDQFPETVQNLRLNLTHHSVVGAPSNNQVAPDLTQSPSSKSLL